MLSKCPQKTHEDMTYQCAAHYIHISNAILCITCLQVQDSYYGQQEARIGHFPSSVVEETHPLMPATTEVQTTVGEHTHFFSTSELCVAFS